MLGCAGVRKIQKHSSLRRRVLDCDVVTFVNKAPLHCLGLEPRPIGHYLVDGAWWFALARARRDEMEQHAVQVQAETYVDQDGVEKLRRVRFDSRQIDITENIDQWHGVDYRYFKVRGGDGNLYILRHNEIRADWELKMYEQLVIGPSDDR